jgi:hypothetical protein
VSGLTGGDGIVTLVAAVVTLVVLGGLLGERRLFGWSQHLFAGLVTGYLVLLAITEVIVPRVLVPLADAPAERLDLWLAVGLTAVTAAAPWLPRRIAAIPMSIAIGALAAFALGGAVVGTILPQLAATVVRPDADPAAVLASAGAAAVTALVLVGFLHGSPRGGLVGGAASVGRWLMLAGIGGWLGYLLFSRLVLLVDRVGFLVGDWLGLGR